MSTVKVTPPGTDPSPSPSPGLTTVDVPGIGPVSVDAGKSREFLELLAKLSAEPATAPRSVGAPAASPTRPISEIEADLATVKARYKLMTPKVEADNAKVNRSKGRVERLMLKHKMDNPVDSVDAEPFDPDAYNPPAVIAPANHELNKAYHAIHYTIADLEAELKAASPGAASVSAQVRNILESAAKRL